MSKSGFSRDSYSLPFISLFRVFNILSNEIEVRSLFYRSFKEIKFNTKLEVNI